MEVGVAGSSFKIMKYILHDKYYENEKEISKEEALKLLANCYRNPEYALDNAERLFNNHIGLRNFNLEIKD